MTKRKKSKYPALNKGVNTLTRKDAMECPYMDGIKDKHGNLVTRAWTEEEKAWMNQFLEETVVTNFLHGKGMKQKNNEKLDILNTDEVKELKALKKVAETSAEKTRLNELLKLAKEQVKDDMEDELETIEEELQELREQFLLYPDKEDHKKFYKENNIRNRDLYNKLKNQGHLIDLTAETYDKFMAERFDGIDVELAIINEIEGDNEDE